MTGDMPMMMMEGLAPMRLCAASPHSFLYCLRGEANPRGVGMVALPGAPEGNCLILARRRAGEALRRQILLGSGERDRIGLPLRRIRVGLDRCKTRDIDDMALARPRVFTVNEGQV